MFKHYLITTTDAVERSILRDWTMTRGNCAVWCEDDQGRVTIVVEEKLGVGPTWTGLESAYGSWITEIIPE